MSKTKKVLLGVLSTACLSSVSPVSSFAATENVTMPPIKEFSKENIDVQVISHITSEDSKVRQSEIIIDGTRHIVNYDFNSGTVKIDGILQKDLEAKWDPSKSVHPKNTNSLAQRAAANPYKYVGTINGHTKTAKTSAMIAVAAAGLAPGLHVAPRALISILNIYASIDIPMAYYSYDLYEKNPLTTNWYQYTVVKFYEDENHTKQVGTTLMGTPFKVYLPNS
ncbi:hypothetical protein QRE66_27415 (plasmid) [Bacillus cereus]|nr:hypothetical protein QRE66_27415 [Bacillus cereus]